MLTSDFEQFTNGIKKADDLNRETIALLSQLENVASRIQSGELGIISSVQAGEDVFPAEILGHLRVQIINQVDRLEAVATIMNGFAAALPELPAETPEA